MLKISFNFELYATVLNIKLIGEYLPGYDLEHQKKQEN